MNDLVPLAIVIAIEPLPLVAFIVVLSTDRGVRNGAAFIAGWVACLAVIVTAVLALTGGNPPKPSTAPSTGVGVVNLLLGLLLVAIAVHVSRLPADRDRPRPSWMAKVDNMKYLGAAGLGVLVQPWPLVAAGAASVAQADLSNVAAVIQVVLFCLLATGSLAAIEVYAIRSPEASREGLVRLQRWLETHRDRAIVIVSVVVGVWLIAKGLVTVL